MNKTALITGSTSGIGLGIAKCFAKQGYNIMLHGLETNGPEIAQQIANENQIKTAFSNANLTNAEDIEKLVEQTVSTFGSIDVLVNNAGIQHVAPIEEFPNTTYEKIIAINMNSVFYASKAAWKHMKNQKFGRIINISSVHGIRASEFKSAYVTAKHGVVGLTKVLGLEGAPFNITCNAICPGYVKTPLVENQIKDQAKAHQLSEDEVVEKIMLKKQAVKDFIPVEKIGEMALFLAAENANAVTGTHFTLDGGWSAQ